MDNHLERYVFLVEYCNLLHVDDVARFHLRNGAIFHSINFLANPSENGLMSSAGMMINYLYDLKQVEANTKTFISNPEQFPIGETIQMILKSK